MVKVIKQNKKAEAFSSAKIVKSCKKAGIPEPIAKAIASIVKKKISKKKTIKSSDIKKLIFGILKKLGKIPKSWLKYEKAKRKKKVAAKKKKAKKKAVKKKKAKKK